MKITNLSKRFGKKILFDKFNLEIAEIGILAIKGNSGCGKTTLMRIIAGLDKKYTGKIEYGNIKSISYVFQEPRLLPSCTVLENVALPLGNTEKAKATAKFWLTRLGLEEDLNTYPDELSGGMKMRVAIARAFAYDGDILLLDEAFNGIDADRTKDIMDMVIEYAKKKTCIVITHNQDQLDYLQCKIVNI
ncbi:MAG: ABC transporter ATP-binding protein [Clostridia bacterium]|nr:ABC transporter ATP-binding protein [Clostridia bacterium]